MIKYEAQRRDLGCCYWCTAWPKQDPADPDAVMLIKLDMSDYVLQFHRDMFNGQEAPPETITYTRNGISVEVKADKRLPWANSFACPWPLTEGDKVEVRYGAVPPDTAMVGTTIYNHDARSPEQTRADFSGAMAFLKTRLVQSSLMPEPGRNVWTSTTNAAPGNGIYTDDRITPPAAALKMLGENLRQAIKDGEFNVYKKYP